MSEACQEMSRATRSRPTSISARRSEVDQEQRRRLSVVKGDVSEEMDEGSQRDILMHLLSGVSSEPELICGETSEASDENEDEEDFCWVWDDHQKSNDVILCNNNREAYFHPDYSCGTAAVRGTRVLSDGEEHYWEVKMSSAVYGTDMMIGIGTKEVDLSKYKSQFCSLLGRDAESWGISYFGTLHSNGQGREYTKKFERGTVIGIHLDMWNGTLIFYKNGKSLGIAAENLQGKKLFPMISSTAARTRMKLIRSHSTNFSLQYLCCKEISKNIPNTREAVAELPLPAGLKNYLWQQMGWIFRLNNINSGGLPPRTKRLRR